MTARSATALASLQSGLPSNLLTPAAPKDYPAHSHYNSPLYFQEGTRGSSVDP